MTLPYLVLLRQTEIIEKIAQADGPNMSPHLVCVKEENMASILTLLLTQETDDLEKYTMRLLKHISPDFRNLSLGEIVRSGPIPIAAELMKVAGDDNGARKERVSTLLPSDITHPY